MSRLPRHRTVSDVMTRHVHVASPLTPFKLLVRLIEENRVSAIPIVDQPGKPIGIVSQTDLLLKQMRPGRDLSRDLLHFEKRRHERVKAGGTLASDVMTSPVITVGSDADLGAAQVHEERADDVVNLVFDVRASRDNDLWIDGWIRRRNQAPLG